jgi:hypothetical protein
VSGGQIIIAALAIIGGAWLLSRYLGRERVRPMLASYDKGLESRVPREVKAAAGIKGGAGGRAELQSQPPHTHTQHTGPQSHFRTED